MLLRLATAVLSLALLSGCPSKEPEVKSEFPASATVIGDNTSVRTDPLTMAPEVQTLSTGTKVKILGRSPEPMRIGKLNEHWYRIELESGLKGWVYGGKLSLGSGNASLTGVEQKLADDFEKQIVGKWWEIRPDGSTGYRKFVFWPDRKYKYGYGADYYGPGGTYELVLTRRLVHLEPTSGVGDNLTVKHVGTDVRLQAEHDGTVYTFRRGDSDPDGKEVTPAEADAKKSRVPKPSPAAKSP